MSSTQNVGHGQFSGIGAQAHAELEQMLMASARSSQLQRINTQMPLEKGLTFKEFFDQQQTERNTVPLKNPLQQ